MELKMKKQLIKESINIVGDRKDNLSQALEYADRGWPVLPLHTPVGDKCSCGDPDCSSIGKHPVTKHGCKDKTNLVPVFFRIRERHETI